MFRETRPGPRRYELAENALLRAVRTARACLASGGDDDSLVPKRVADLPDEPPLTRTGECLKTRF